MYFAGAGSKVGEHKTALFIFGASTYSRLECLT